jgi:DmsE family decaheme c-type cytochrome
MSRRTYRLFAILGGVGVLLLLFVLAFPSSSLAQQASPKPAAAAQATDGYVGSDTCKGCHEELDQKFARTKMGRLMLGHPRNTKEGLGCEGCHGPGKAHVDAGGGRGVGGLITFAKNDRTPVEKRNAVCLQCHQKGARLFWQGSQHESRDVACTNCHKIMEDVSPKFQLAKETVLDTCGQCHQQKKAQAMSRSSHMPLREGKMTCTSCHNPHGTVTPALLREPGLNETCYRCHTEKRGPFLWIHAPVQESCANCHEPHGSNWEKMLKAAKPRLCQQCHSPGSGHPSNMYGRGDTASLKFVMGHQCTNCHALIHGSNHPSGAVFER